MTAVALHQIPHIDELLRHGLCCIPTLALVPAIIAILVHYKNAKPIRKVDPSRNGGVVGHAPCVAADGAEHLRAEKVDSVGDGVADAAPVRVVTESTHNHIRAQHDHRSLKAYLAPTGLVSEPRGGLTCRGVEEPWKLYVLYEPECVGG